MQCTARNSQIQLVSLRTCAVRRTLRVGAETLAIDLSLRGPTIKSEALRLARAYSVARLASLSW